ncbi:MAG: VanZ family protein, partial [Clostridia bacterium]|nr:VanZ family protein [Clostridia bacterium]
LPLGFGFAIKKKKRRILLILLLPVFASCLVEFSQFLLKNGHVDIDDVILNVLGFYLGVLLKMLVDLVRRIVTRGEEKTIFSL